ncbi:MAG: flavodoxin family protein [Lachnospiraceae bacterium]|nr:flavodoxin family protein [Lachnospiraceae bacterium]
MKILVINGSPKGEKSNTFQMTQAFLDGVSEGLRAGGEPEERRVLQVRSLKVAPCKGCFACWNKTPGKCCIQDDMSEVTEAELWADLIVWSFPLYYFNVPGPLKSLIDRQLPMVLPFMTEREDGAGSGSHPSRYDMSGKKYVLVSTCGFYSAAKNYDSVLSMFDHICGKDNYETVFCGQGELFRIPELSERTGEYLEQVRKAGCEYIDGAITEGTRARLDELLFPKEVFETMADASWGVSKTDGAKEEESLIFTRQMAALYRKQAHDGTDRVLEMCYTDLDVSYQILLGKDGSRVYTDGSLKTTTRIETPFPVWTAIARGEIRGEEALAKQMYRVEGDFGLMLKWDDFFGAGTPAERNSDQSNAEGHLHVPPKAPVMLNMLIPWIVFWVAVPIHCTAGALISILVCALVPVLSYSHKRAVYDAVSCAAVTVLSAAELVIWNRGGNIQAIIPLSYLLFGLMWIVSCRFRIPLTAHYVMYNYNGEDAVHNPLFMDTNRILTFAWGILYVLTSVWTWFLMRTEIGPYAGAVNTVVPVFMGLFTRWFEHWYPAWVAGGKHRR